MKKNENMEKDLNVIAPYIKSYADLITISIVILVIGGVGIYIYNNYCKKPDDFKKSFSILQKDIETIKKDIKKIQKKCQPSKSLNQCIDAVEAEINFKTKIGDSSIDLSMKGQQNPYIRSNCFWFMVIFVIALCFILLFYLISRSSRESRLLQFINDWKEQEKEIKLKEIEREIEIKKIENKKEKGKF